MLLYEKNITMLATQSARILYYFSRFPLHMMKQVASSVDCPATGTSPARTSRFCASLFKFWGLLICSSTKQAHQHTIVKMVAQLPDSVTPVPLCLLITSSFYSEQATSMGINLYTHNKHTLFVEDLQTLQKLTYCSNRSRKASPQCPLPTIVFSLLCLLFRALAMVSSDVVLSCRKELVTRLTKLT